MEYADERTWPELLLHGLHVSQPLRFANARTKRPLCVRALRIRLHLETMMAQERMLKASKMKRTVLATAPLCEIMSKTSPPT